MNTDRFKFRIFSKVEKRYISTERFVLNQDGELVEPNYTFYGDIHFSRPTENLIVEQCTGLKDANGKLIYEGDIICGGYIIPSDVKRDDYGFLLDFAISCNKYATLRAAIEQGVAIIGNIHETPELLEAKK